VYKTIHICIMLAVKCQYKNRIGLPIDLLVYTFNTNIFEHK